MFIVEPGQPRLSSVLGESWESPGNQWEEDKGALFTGSNWGSSFNCKKHHRTITCLLTNTRLKTNCFWRKNTIHVLYVVFQSLKFAMTWLSCCYCKDCSILYYYTNLYANTILTNYSLRYYVMQYPSRKKPQYMAKSLFTNSLKKVSF